MRHNGSNWVHQDTEKLDFGVGAGWVPSATPNQNWWVPGGCQGVSATKYITRVQWACPTPPSTLPAPFPHPPSPAPTLSLTKTFYSVEESMGVRGGLYGGAGGTSN